MLTKLNLTIDGSVQTFIRGRVTLTNVTGKLVEVEARYFGLMDGREYSLCLEGRCDGDCDDTHSHAPKGAEVWHDADHTRTLWVAKGVS